MSGWRRRAIAMFPTLRDEVQRARRPDDLVPRLVAFAHRILVSEPPDPSALKSVVTYAREILEFPGDGTSVLLRSLLLDPATHSHVREMLTEREFHAMKGALQSLVSEHEWIHIESEFIAACRRRDSELQARARSVFEELHARSPDPGTRVALVQCWLSATELFDVGEDCIAFENFRDDVGEAVPMLPTEIRARFDEA